MSAGSSDHCRAMAGWVREAAARSAVQVTNHEAKRAKRRERRRSATSGAAIAKDTSEKT
nr:hypothetical protein [Deltaproteobacteria bacterium]